MELNGHGNEMYYRCHTGMRIEKKDRLLNATKPGLCVGERGNIQKTKCIRNGDSKTFFFQLFS